jgi:hypothetical protein
VEYGHLKIFGFKGQKVTIRWKNCTTKSVRVCIPPNNTSIRVVKENGGM